MKMKILLGVSLCLNVLLGVWLLRGIAASPDIRTILVTNAEPLVIERIVTNNGAGSLAKASRSFDWRAVESADYREYIANLRAIGCPEETLRDIIVADVSQLYKARAMEGANTNKYQYWKPGIPFAGLLDEGHLVKQQQLAEEKRVLLKELLGAEVSLPMDALGGVNPLDQMLEFLPEATRNEMMNLEQRYGVKLGKVMQEATQGDLSAMKSLMAEKDAEMLGILGPEQKLEYDLRMSQTAMVLRMQLGEFEPTEQEFRAMFQVRKAFDDQFGLAELAALDPSNAEQRKSAESGMRDQLKTALGEERYREYRYEQDWMNSSLRHVSREFNIPKTEALRVFDIKEAAEAEAARVRQDAGFTREEQQQLLAKIRQETESAVAGLLGAEAAGAYVERGSWIKQLHPQASPPAQ